MSRSLRRSRPGREGLELASSHAYEVLLLATTLRLFDFTCILTVLFDYFDLF